MTLDFRPLRDTDYDSLADLLNVAAIVDGRAQHVVGEELREEFESMPVDLPVDTLAAWDGGRLVGVVYMMFLRSTVREERCYVLKTWVQLMHIQVLQIQVHLRVLRHGRSCGRH